MGRRQGSGALIVAEVLFGTRDVVDGYGSGYGYDGYGSGYGYGDGSGYGDG